MGRERGIPQRGGKKVMMSTTKVPKSTYKYDSVMMKLIVLTLIYA